MLESSSRYCRYLFREKRCLGISCDFVYFEFEILLNKQQDATHLTIGCEMPTLSQSVTTVPIVKVRFILDVFRNAEEGSMVNLTCHLNNSEHTLRWGILRENQLKDLHQGPRTVVLDNTLTILNITIGDESIYSAEVNGMDEQMIDRCFFHLTVFGMCQMMLVIILVI